MNRYRIHNAHGGMEVLEADDMVGAIKAFNRLEQGRVTYREPVKIERIDPRPEDKPTTDTRVKTTDRTVWVAVSVWHDDCDGLDPITAIGDTAEAADEALEDTLRADFSVDDAGQTYAEWRELWIDSEAQQLPVHSLRA